MRKRFMTAVVAGILCLGCSTAENPTSVGSSVGSVLRAPVDFFSGIGNGITGGSFTPHRQFNPDFEKQKSDEIFWENKETFFSGL